MPLTLTSEARVLNSTRGVAPGGGVGGEAPTKKNKCKCLKKRGQIYMKDAEYAETNEKSIFPFIRFSKIWSFCTKNWSLFDEFRIQNRP